jgi:hypothetical protein
MRQILQLSVLFCTLCAPAALGQSLQTAPPPPPVILLPQQSANATCTITCDSAAMFCLNTCVGSGGAASTPASAQCNLNCTTSQLVCKSRC